MPPAALTLICIAAMALSMQPPAAWASPASGALSPEGSQPSQAAGYLAEAKDSLGLQTDLPGGEKALWKPHPFWDFLLPKLKMSRRTAAFVLWAAAAAITAIILAKFRDNLWSASRARRLESLPNGDGAPALSAERMEIARAEADDMARAGDFAGAVHALLLRSVREMRGRMPGHISASLTSRELLNLPTFSAQERSVFETIVSCVEISYFGSHQPGEDEYLSCRRCFDELAGLLGRGEAA
ncbi:MAG: hypothetical protein LBQ36_06415 [Synergistaceae bacterium]|nr:hypothetical protein [Synergistaceae bacterium]